MGCICDLMPRIGPRRRPSSKGDERVDYKYGTSRLTVSGSDETRYRIVMMEGLQSVVVITATYSTRCEAQAALNTRAKNMNLEPWRDS